MSLVSPQQFKPDRGSRFSGRKAYGAWLNSLPLANMSAAGNELLAGLQELNHTRISPRFRMQCLEQLNELVLSVVTSLDKHYRDQGFPLSDKNDKIGRVAVHFFRELALGYRLSADHLCNSTPSASRLQRGSVAMCIHRSLSSLEQMMFRASLQYHAPPDGLWNEIHILYAFARQNGLHSKSYKDALGWLKQDFTIDDIYKRIALVGISDPSRLSQKAVHQLYLASELLARKTRVLPGTAGDAVAGRFAIDVDSDEPPVLIGEDAVGERADFLFDIRELRQELAEVLEASRDPLREVPFRVANQEPVFLDTSLLMQLVNTWGQRLNRSYERVPASHEIRMMVGLNSVHHTIAGQMSFDQFLDQSRNEEFLQDTGAASNWIQTSDGGQRPTPLTAMVVNQSLGGYRLRLTDVRIGSLRVGELVSLCASSIQNRDALWMIGTVRWLHASDGHEIELGVSIIGQDPRAAALRMPKAEGAHAMPAFRGLLIRPFGRGSDQPETLLVPSFYSRRNVRGLMFYRDGDDFTVSPVHFLNIVEKTSEYCRYRFDTSAADEAEAPEASADDGPQSGEPEDLRRRIGS